jgi:hypothetical protein
MAGNRRATTIADNDYLVVRCPDATDEIGCSHKIACVGVVQSFSDLAETIPEELH